MLRRNWEKILLATALLLFFGAASAGYKLGYRGSEYARFYSPDKRFVIVLDHTLSRNSFATALPGQGSDYIDGYIRLYDARGKKLNEHFAHALKFIEPHWSEREVIIVSEDLLWELPAN